MADDAINTHPFPFTHAPSPHTTLPTPPCPTAMADPPVPFYSEAALHVTQPPFVIDTGAGAGEGSPSPNIGDFNPLDSDHPQRKYRKHLQRWRDRWEELVFDAGAWWRSRRRTIMPIVWKLCILFVVVCTANVLYNFIWPVGTQYIADKQLHFTEGVLFMTPSNIDIKQYGTASRVPPGDVLLQPCTHISLEAMRSGYLAHPTSDIIKYSLANLIAVQRRLLLPPPPAAAAAPPPEEMVLPKLYNLTYDREMAAHPPNPCLLSYRLNATHVQHMLNPTLLPADPVATRYSVAAIANLDLFAHEKPLKLRRPHTIQIRYHQWPDRSIVIDTFTGELSHAFQNLLDLLLEGKTYIARHKEQQQHVV